MKRNCDNCNKEYEADKRNLRRGWGLTCSKSCAASKREKTKRVSHQNKVNNNYKSKPIFDRLGDLIDDDFGMSVDSFNDAI